MSALSSASASAFAPASAAGSITSSFPSFSEIKAFLSDNQAPYYKYMSAINANILELLHALLSLAVYIVLTILKLALLVYPSVRSTIFSVIEYHRNEFGLREYFIEFMFIVSLFVWYFYGRSIKRSFSALQKKVEEKSRFLASNLAIILYIASCFFMTFAGAKIILPLITPGRLPLITIIVPLCTTASALLAFDASVIVQAAAALPVSSSSSLTSAPSSTATHASSSSANSIFVISSDSAVAAAIRIWLILGTYHSMHMLFDTIPFFSWGVRLVGLDKSYVSVFGAVVLITAQLNSKIAMLVLTYFFNPVIAYIEQYIPSTSKAESLFQSLLYPLSAMNVLSKEKIDLLSTFSRDFFISVVALFSIVLGYPLVNIGLLTIVFFIPVSRCSMMVNVKVDVPIGHSNSNSNVSNSSKRNELHERCLFWLRYWVLVATWLLWDQLVANVSNQFLFMRVSIVFFMWLQHEYYRGADKVLSFIVDASKKSTRQAAVVRLAADDGQAFLVAANPLPHPADEAKME